MARKKEAARQSWRGVFVDARLSIMRSNIDRLRNFYEEGESHFTFGFKSLEKKVDHLTPEQWADLQDFYIQERYEMEELRELKRNFSIVGLFTVLERFLRHTLRYLRKAGAPVTGRIRGMSLGDMRDAFKKVDVLITEPNHVWHAIMGMKLVRNCITHYDGHPHKEMAKQLKEDYKIPLIEERWKPTNGGKSAPTSWRIQLADEYFGKSADLVKRVCRLAARGHYKYV